MHFKLSLNQHEAAKSNALSCFIALNLKKMTSTPFLTINNQTLSLKQAISYLKTSGKLGVFLAEILRQYLIEYEIEEFKGVSIEDSQIEQSIIDFRISNRLTDSQDFQVWLSGNQLSYEDFRKGVTSDLKLEILKSQIAEQKLEEHFNNQKPVLDRVVISRLILDSQEQAQSLKQRILEDRTQFEALVREYSLTDDRFSNGMMGAIAKGQIPNILRTALDLANPGDILGPFEMEDRHGLFRVETFIPASLEDETLREELKNQIFEEWLQNKMQNLDIRLDIVSENCKNSGG